MGAAGAVETRVAFLHGKLRKPTTAASQPISARLQPCPTNSPGMHALVAAEEIVGPEQRLQLHQQPCCGILDGQHLADHHHSLGCSAGKWQGGGGDQGGALSACCLLALRLHPVIAIPRLMAGHALGHCCACSPPAPPMVLPLLPSPLRNEAKPQGTKAKNRAARARLQQVEGGITWGGHPA